MLKHTLKDSFEKFLRSRGYYLTKTPEIKNNMEAAIRRIAARNLPIQTVIDVGAAQAGWTSMVMPYFSNCDYLLVEAQPVHEATLTQFCQTHSNAHYVLAAAGETTGTLHFNAAEPLGGQASYTPYAKHNIEVPVTTLDQEVRSRHLKPPYLLKLDTHGFEVPILKGAIDLLNQTEAIVMECYNFKIAPECLLFFEMCDYLKQWGFKCVDLVEPMHRLYDQSLWQMDLVFLRADRSELTYCKYR